MRQTIFWQYKNIFPGLPVNWNPILFKAWDTTPYLECNLVFYHTWILKPKRHGCRDQKSPLSATSQGLQCFCLGFFVSIAFSVLSPTDFFYILTRAPMHLNILFKHCCVFSRCFVTEDFQLTNGTHLSRTGNPLVFLSLGFLRVNKPKYIKFMSNRWSVRGSYCLFTTSIILGWCKIIAVLHCWTWPFDTGIHSEVNVVMLYIILMHISCLVFFANKLLLDIYFICILDYGNDVRQKANLSSFLIQVQNGS